MFVHFEQIPQPFLQLLLRDLLFSLPGRILVSFVFEHRVHTLFTRLHPTPDEIGRNGDPIVPVDIDQRK